MTLIELVQNLDKLVGVAALIAALVNTLKALGWVKDGQAMPVQALLNIGGLILLVAAGVFHFDVSRVDSILGGLAAVLTTLTVLLSQIGLTDLWHRIYKGFNLPVVGTSFSP